MNNWSTTGHESNRSKVKGGLRPLGAEDLWLNLTVDLRGGVPVEVSGGSKRRQEHSYRYIKSKIQRSH